MVKQQLLSEFLSKSGSRKGSSNSEVLEVVILDDDSSLDCSELTVSYSLALVGVSYNDTNTTASSAEERETDSAPMTVSVPPARNPNPLIATADCERSFSAMNCIKTSPQN